MALENNRIKIKKKYLKYFHNQLVHIKFQKNNLPIFEPGSLYGII